MIASAAHVNGYATLPAMDRDKLVELRTVVGEAELRVMLDLLPAEGQRAMEAIETARVAGDMDRARRAAHGLKGLAGNFGAQRIETVARDIENAASALEDLDSLLPILATAIEEMRADIASAS
jgi:HPt (histidine-containing phosphotransfer) domain-containing protein